MEMTCYTLSDSYSHRFLRMPKFLLEQDNLADRARTLYSLMMDRLLLSIKNKWTDKNGAVYIIYTRDEMCEVLRCSKPTAIKAMKQLRQAGLLCEKRRGWNKPNLIYLYHPVLHNEKQDAPVPAGSKDSLPPEVKNLYPSNTDLIKTNPFDMISDKRKKAVDAADERTVYEIILKGNIGYERLIQNRPQDSRIIGELLDVMIEGVSSKSKTLRVNRKNIPADAVKSRLLKLGGIHIRYVLECLSKAPGEIKNLRAYLLSALYNAPETMDGYYRHYRARGDRKLRSYRSPEPTASYDIEKFEELLSNASVWDGAAANECLS